MVAEVTQVRPHCGATSTGFGVDVSPTRQTCLASSVSAQTTITIITSRGYHVASDGWDESQTVVRVCSSIMSSARHIGTPA
jgi:hypothetical protein